MVTTVGILDIYGGWGWVESPAVSQRPSPVITGELSQPPGPEIIGPTQFEKSTVLHSACREALSLF